MSTVMPSFEDMDLTRDTRDDVTRIWLNKDDVISQVRPQDVVDYLRQDDILSETEQELIFSEKTTRAKAQALLDLVLGKGQRGGTMFLHALGETYEHLYRQICNTDVSDSSRRRFLASRASSTMTETHKQQTTKHKPHTASKIQPLMTGLEELSFDEVDCSSVSAARLSTHGLNYSVHSDGVMQKLRDELCDFYLHELRVIHPVPWNDEIMLDMFNFYQDNVLLDITNKHVASSPQSVPKTPGSTVNEIRDWVQLFKDDMNESPCRRILIEGEPGIGKSTLVNRIALEWAIAKTSHLNSQQGRSKWTEKFDHILHLRANELRDSLATSVIQFILPEDITDIEKDQLELRFLDSEIQQKTLLIIDAYDEADVKTLIHDIWEGRILRKCTMIITSRPNQSIKLLRDLEKRCSVQGFTAANRDAYVDQYASQFRCRPELKVDVKKMESFLGHITYVPMYVSLLCMLLEEKADIPSTRTKLLAEVVSLAEERTATKRNQPPAAIQEHTELLAKFAFEMLCQTQGNFKRNALTEEGLALGFVVTERGKSKLHPTSNTKFIHKIFQEYFAARYLSSLPYQDMLQQMKLLSEENKRSVVIYLAGLYSVENPPMLFAFYNDLVSQTFDNRALIEEHVVHHKGLQCLAETGSFPGLESMVANIVPKQFHFSSDECSHCLDGLEQIQEVCYGHADLSIDTSDISYDTASSESIKRDLTNHNRIFSIVFTSKLPSTANMTDSILFYLPILLHLKHLFVYCGDNLGNAIARKHDISSMRGRSRLRSLVFKGSSSRHVTGAEHVHTYLDDLLMLLVKLSSAELKCLVLKAITISSMALEHCRSSLASCANIEALILDGVSFPFNNFETFLDIFSKCKKIKHLEINNCFEFEEAPTVKTTTEFQFISRRNQPAFKRVSTKLPRLVYRIIANNKLETFVLNGQDVDWSTLTSSLENSSQSLRVVDLSSTNLEIDDLHILSGVFEKAEVVKLKGMKCQPQLIVKVIEKAASLVDLDLSRNTLDGVDIFSDLCRCLSGRSTLKNLTLSVCHLTDQNILLLQSVLENNQLEVLDLTGNCIAASEESCHQIIDMLSSAKYLHKLAIPLSYYTNGMEDQFVQVARTMKYLNELQITAKVCPTVEAFLLEHHSRGTERMSDKLRRLIPQLRMAHFGVTTNVLWVPTVAYWDDGHSYLREICMKYH